MMQLTVSSGDNLVGVSLQPPTLSRFVGGYCLDLPLRLHFVADAGRMFSLHNLSSRLSIMQPHQNIHVGTALPSAPIWLASSKNPLEPTYSVQLGLSLGQLNELESLRSGGDISFMVHVSGLVTRGKSTQPVSAAEELRVPQSNWIEQLEKCGYKKILLLEIPILETTAFSQSPVVAGELAEAQDHLARGQFTAVISSCRKALEALETALSDKTSLQSAVDAYRKDKPTRETMSFTQRLLLVRAALNHSLHLSHHADAVAANVEYGRRDAIWALTMTAATVRHALDVT